MNKGNNTITKERQNTINCSAFEELLSDYIDKTLERAIFKQVAEHALVCPLCHSLLNEVKESLQACRTISAPTSTITRLEARVLSMTMPETAITCYDFENQLTDYLDGFLTATSFHRWERHAALCTECEELPGMVVRSIAACYSYKAEEIPVPEGLNERILKSTVGFLNIETEKPSLASQVGEWWKGFSFPVAVPQLASVGFMMIFAFMMFSQTVSADGSLTGVYQESVELAKQTYKQGADAWNGKLADSNRVQTPEPIAGTTNIDHEGNK